MKRLETNQLDPDPSSHPFTVSGSLPILLFGGELKILAKVLVESFLFWMFVSLFISAIKLILRQMVITPKDDS